MPTRHYLICATVLALLVCAAALVSAAAGPVLLYLTALLALIAMVVNVRTGKESLQVGTPVVVALCAPLAVMLVSSVMHGQWSSSEFEKLLRFALAAPAAWLLLRADRRWLRYVQWAFLFSAYAGSLMLIVIVSTNELGRMAVSEYGGRYNAVAFADLTLFFGFAATLTMPWTNSPWPRVENALKAAATPIAVYAVWLSQTRSSWVLVGVLALVIFLGNSHWSRRAKAGFAAAALAIVVSGTAISWYSADSRMSAAWTDVQRYEQQDRDTSVGIRLQLWQASWLMFKQSPLLGVYPSNFRDELVKLEQQGIVTPTVVEGYGEPHNDFLNALAGYGLLGFLTICALYFMPAWIFLRRLRHPDESIRTAARIGLLFTLGYACFSLTEMMFRNMRSVPIYGVTLVILYALASPRPSARKAD
ncbi:O-antigen ligase [Bordetella sp. LUAb4]|uniref:O-antigen ligase family protein n=1 Tax=Bordetella sp. LUAb4 TaxID=2843195 RepID=UPI001E4B393C|nr:O-antigen ligase family protein [Bordetella sp. LUAb4]